MSPRRPAPRTSLPRQDSLAFALLEAGHLVDAVLCGRNLTDAFEQARDLAVPPWPDSARGAIRDMAWRCLRDYGRGNKVLSCLLSKPLPQPVQAVLLVALHRLEVRPEQAHTIVDQAVTAVRTLAPGLAGVTNGVLRNAQRQAADLHARMASDQEWLYRHPEWWIKRVQSSFPLDWATTLEQSNQPPPMSLRVNIRRASVDHVLRKLQQEDIEATRLSNDALLLAKPVGVSALPGFAEGEVSVQDAGAQWAARWLNPKDGERVLDACCAPGGKTAHLLELADSDLLALELDAARLSRVCANLARLGLSAKLQQADASRPDTWWDGRPFDAILADVPCSASGVSRRHPDIKWLRRDEDIRRFAKQQKQIIDALWKTLARGGRMLYVTCSLFDEENEAQIQGFLSNHADARREPVDDEQHQQLLPSNEHDGFYYALLRKN